MIKEWCAKCKGSGLSITPMKQCGKCNGMGYTELKPVWEGNSDELINEERHISDFFFFKKGTIKHEVYIKELKNE